MNQLFVNRNQTPKTPDTTPSDPQPFGGSLSSLWCGPDVVLSSDWFCIWSVERNVFVTFTACFFFFCISWPDLCFSFSFSYSRGSTESLGSVIKFSHWKQLSLWTSLGFEFSVMRLSKSTNWFQHQLILFKHSIYFFHFIFLIFNLKFTFQIAISLFIFLELALMLLLICPLENALKASNVVVAETNALVTN